MTVYDFLRTFRTLALIYGLSALVVGVPVWLATGAKSEQFPWLLPVLAVPSLWRAIRDDPSA